MNCKQCQTLKRVHKNHSPDTQSLSECYASTTCYTSEIYVETVSCQTYVHGENDKITPPCLKNLQSTDVRVCHLQQKISSSQQIGYFITSNSTSIQSNKN